MTDLSVHTPTGAAPTAATGVASSESSDLGTFLDTVLDIVNPLQHLPVISTLYRSITGDEISAPARVVGGTLFGGPLGTASAVVNLIVEDVTGNDIGDNVLALLTGEDESAEAMQLASLNGTPPPAPRRGKPVMEAYRDFGAMMPDYETWNGQWQAHAGAGLQQAQVSPPAPATTAKTTTTPAPESATVAAPPAASPATQQKPVQASAETAPTPKPEADRADNAAAIPQAPAWLAAALADAEAERTASPAEPVADDKESPEWISAAMAHALDKYQAMAIARSSDRAAAKAAKAVDFDN